MNDFRPILLENMPPKVEKSSSLSTDAKYLYEMACAVSEGFCSNDLANIKPGPVVHSRWLTKASRILRLYVTTSKPSSNLQTLATYIIKVYVPMYFQIKYYSSVVYGSALFAKFIKYSRYLCPQLRRVIDAVIQNNCYFAHPENILLSMLYDNRKAIRDLAIRKILHYRDDLCESEDLRKYNKPKLNFECVNYVDMIDLSDDILTEPPYTKNIPYDHLKAFLEEDEIPLCDPNFPCHIQGTERFVQLLTSVSRRVVPKNREAVMAVTVESRSKIPRIESKKDLKF